MSAEEQRDTHTPGSLRFSRVIGYKKWRCDVVMQQNKSHDTLYSHLGCHALPRKMNLEP
jgi:hypothetical protein